tara:strand:- start:1074 stop:1790 length:717 start_codon:yes stop_codon:yes gene_type:complete
MKRNVKVEFICDKALYGVLPNPKPANKMLPQWFRKMSEFTPDGDKSPGTMKACIPLRDAMSSGYIIPLWTDIHAEQHLNENVQFYTPSETNYGIGWHTEEQIKGSPLKNKSPINPWKLLNPWTIRTPKGYSCLITHPINQPNDHIEFVSAIVDTDVFNAKINFPFLWKRPYGKEYFSDIIPAGSPTVQVIPFKREDFEMDVRPSTDNDDSLWKKTLKTLDLSYNGKYRKWIWQRKKYR